MARAYEFFATREDLLGVLESVESLRPIQYVRAGLFPGRDPIIADSARKIERLGIATHGDQNLEPMYLIMNQGSPVTVRPVPQRRGGVRYAIDQRKNPKSVVIKTGGEYKDEALIPGQIGTVSSDQDSLSLLELLGRLVRQNFESVRGSYLGKGAAQALDAGIRLTGSIRAPRQFDLRRPGSE